MRQKQPRVFGNNRPFSPEEIAYLTGRVPSYEEAAKLTERKDEELPKPNRLLPAWFTERMTSDVWSFGLLTSSNTIIGIATITAIVRDVQGELWIDVELLGNDHLWLEELRKKCPGILVLGAPVERENATIKASHIVAAFELADT